jgi:hypothetical protein
MGEKAGSRLRGRRGSVLMIVLILMALLAAVPIMMQLVTSNTKSANAQTTSVAQANNMARAGLLDAINWFRRQSSTVKQGSLPYPDAAFQPVYSTNTATSDTMDSNIGIVEQYQIDSNGKLWGRYEVHKATAGLTFPADTNSVHDITGLRVSGGTTGQGLVWFIESTGYVFLNANPSKLYNVAPNKILGKSRIITEIRSVSFLPPLAATIIMPGQGATSAVTMNNNTKLQGATSSTPVIGYYTLTNGSGITVTNNNVGNPSSFSGTEVQITTATAVPQPQAIFGMSAHDLSLVADFSVTNVNQLPTSGQNGKLIFINGSASFSNPSIFSETVTPSPTAASGSFNSLLYVTGSLSVPTATNQPTFTGVIFTGGAISLDAIEFSGQIITTANSGTAVTISGDNSPATVVFSQSVLNQTAQLVGQYRESRAEFYTFTAYQDKQYTSH